MGQAAESMQGPEPHLSGRGLGLASKLLSKGYNNKDEDRALSPLNVQFNALTSRLPVLPHSKYNNRETIGDRILER